MTEAATVLPTAVLLAAAAATVALIIAAIGTERSPGAAQAGGRGHIEGEAGLAVAKLVAALG
jgi:hypothetical protein